MSIMLIRRIARRYLMLAAGSVKSNAEAPVKITCELMNMR